MSAEPEGPTRPVPSGTAADGDADVIESTGETIEMDVSQLEALLAAERAASS
jgi:hypothetical protein